MVILFKNDIFSVVISCVVILLNCFIYFVEMEQFFIATKANIYDLKL